MRQDLIAAALGVFDARGCRGTSTERLVREPGVNRNSLDAEFGSKDGLFTTVIDQHQDAVVPDLSGPLADPSTTLDDMEHLLCVVSETATGSPGRGCLMCRRDRPD